MKEFTPLPETSPVEEVIKAAFDTTLDISGNWGYTYGDPLVIHTLPEGQTLPQTQHMLASMRSYLEMHLTRPKEERYGSINLNETDREELRDNKQTLHRITYRLEAMKESDYEAFINEYKSGYGKPDFDLNDHFKRRKEATVVRYITVYFNVSEVI